MKWTIVTSFKVILIKGTFLTQIILAKKQLSVIPFGAQIKGDSLLKMSSIMRHCYDIHCIAFKANPLPSDLCKWTMEGGV